MSRSPITWNTFGNEAHRTQQSGETRRSVLIVDDDPVFALLASETLEQAGYAARIASNMQDALAAFAEQNPDLILLDVDLPGHNGFEVCATLRGMAGGVDVPIVMVTGHDDTKSIARAYEVGATDFIHKPVLWPTLPHRVGFMLRALDNMCALRISEQKNRALLSTATACCWSRSPAVREATAKCSSANRWRRSFRPRWRRRQGNR